MPELTRTSMPEHLRFAAQKYPRTGWETHGNFDDLTRFWLDRHVMFREILSRLTAETEAYLDKEEDGPVFAARSARLTGFFLNQLHTHHQIEDLHYFPILQEFDPRLVAGFEMLEADHTVLDKNIHKHAEATNKMLTSLKDGAAVDEAGGVHGLLRNFDKFMDRHLCDEEELVVPTILEYGPIELD